MSNESIFLLFHNIFYGFKTSLSAGIVFGIDLWSILMGFYAVTVIIILIKAFLYSRK